MTSWIGIMTAAWVSACATSPTGRKQLMLVEDRQMSELGEQSFAEMKRQLVVSDDPQAQAYVRCVAKNLITELDRQYQLPEGKAWDVSVFENQTANAFALPGGNIGVFTGMLGVADTEDQLAAVIAHEIGHVIADHGGERISQQLVTQGGLSMAGILLQSSHYQPLILSALGLGAQVGVLLPYSRTQEREADQIGLQLMAEAGFDPRAAVQLWKNMAAQGGAQPPEFLSTHPSHGSRIEELQAHMDEALTMQRDALAQKPRPGCEAFTALSKGRAGGRVPLSAVRASRNTRAALTWSAPVCPFPHCVGVTAAKLVPMRSSSIDP